MADRIEPFVIGVDGVALDDLRDRVRRAGWPEREPVGDWSRGVPLDYLRDLCGYWAGGYDWLAAEARLNQVPQFTTRIDGLDIHFLHVRSPHPGAVPLVMTHGWPGCSLEFEGVLSPPAHGGDPADAFDVVVPSLPGYGFSGKPSATGWDVHRIARAWAELMTRLGYGGSWPWAATGHQHLHQPGAAAPRPAAGHPPGAPLAPPDRSAGDLTGDERAALADLDQRSRSGSGYSAILWGSITRPPVLTWALRRLALIR